MEDITVFHIDKVEPGQYGFEFSGNMFQLLRVRRGSIIVRSNPDEGYSPPYNLHEFPLSIGTIKQATPINLPK